MRLYLESLNEFDQVENAFSAKEDLVGILENAQDSGNALSPIEVATLQMTMKQIDKGMELPATESYTTFPEFFTTLAIENLKENIGNKWKTIVAAIRKVYERVRDFLKAQFQKLKNNFKRKPGADNKHFERESTEQEPPPKQTQTTTEQVEEQETTKQAEKPKEKEVEFVPRTERYKMSLAYFEFGGSANKDSFIQIIELLPKLTDLYAKLEKSHNIRSVATAALNLEDDEWATFLRERAQEILDILVEDYAAETKGYNVDLRIAENISVKMRLQDHNSFPELEINLGNQGTLEITNEDKDYLVKLDKHSHDVINRLQGFFIFGVPDFSNIQDTRAQQRLADVMPLFNARAKLATSIGRFSSSVIDISESILADFRKQG